MASPPTGAARYQPKPLKNHPKTAVFDPFQTCFGPPPLSRLMETPKRVKKGSKKGVFDPKNPFFHCFWRFLGGSPRATAKSPKVPNWHLRNIPEIDLYVRRAANGMHELKKGSKKGVFPMVGQAKTPFFTCF